MQPTVGAFLVLCSLCHEHQPSVGAIGERFFVRKRSQGRVPPDMGLQRMRPHHDPQVPGVIQDAAMPTGRTRRDSQDDRTPDPQDEAWP
jgi:hypothetical protein